MALTDVTQLVHESFNYHAQKAQLTFKWRNVLRYYVKFERFLNK